MSSSSVRMTRTLTRPASGEITPHSPRCAARRVRFREAQPVADPRADQRRVFSDAASEHQRVQSAQRRRECADPFLDLVAKQRDRFSRPHVLRFTVEQVAHVGTGLRHAEQPGCVIDHLLKLLRAHLLGARQVPRPVPDRRSPERVLITNPAVGVKPMLVSMLLPSRTAARLAPLPRWARITRPWLPPGRRGVPVLP